jgi:hypothetical protein
MLIIVSENTIDTFFLDTLFTTAGTVLSKLNRGVFADGMKPGLSSFYGNMILLGHKLSVLNDRLSMVY